MIETLLGAAELIPGFTYFWTALFGTGLAGEIAALILHWKQPGRDGTLSKLVRFVFGFSTKWKWARWLFGAIWSWFGLHIWGIA